MKGKIANLKAVVKVGPEGRSIVETTVPRGRSNRRGHQETQRSCWGTILNQPDHALVLCVGGGYVIHFEHTVMQLDALEGSRAARLQLADKMDQMGAVRGGAHGVKGKAVARVAARYTDLPRLRQWRITRVRLIG